MSGLRDAFAWVWLTARPDLVALVGLPLALGVAAHVLLRKRDVAASVGWIGLAFLSPILGSALYALFGINRVARRARQVRSAPGGTGGEPRDGAESGIPVSLRPLERAAFGLTGNALDAGNAVEILRNGDETFPAMLEAIDGATATLGLSSYIIRDDRAGHAIADALQRAKDRGVDVRVILDGIGSGYFLPAIFGRLRTRGIPVGRFMHSPLPWRMPFLNLRTHKKLLVADGRLCLIGGTNIGDENVLAGDPPDPVRDHHFRIRGPVTRQMVADFAHDWFFVTGEEIGGPGWFPDIHPAGDAEARAVSSGPDEDIEKIEFVLLQAFACARSSIRLMTPYFLPSDIVLTSLAMAAMRGVAVDILVPERSNHRYVDWATWAHVGPILRDGVRIWRNPAPFDHSKLVVVDGTWCCLGSANLDMRSLRLNFELNVEIYDAALAAGLEAFMTARQTRPMTLDDVRGRSLPIRLRDASVRLALPYL